MHLNFYTKSLSSFCLSSKLYESMTHLYVARIAGIVLRIHQLVDRSGMYFAIYRLLLGSPISHWVPGVKRELGGIRYGTDHPIE